jgi:hypothetical protein
MSVCVINLLALLDENKDIFDIAKPSLEINFDQTMMGVYLNKKYYILLAMILQFNYLL